jgi:hypothetical protein
MWWSWSLAAIGVTGLYLVTRRNWRGYLIGVGVQFLWVAYAVVTRQWGFILSALVYGAVNMIGLVGWRREAKRCAVIPCPDFEPVRLNPRVTTADWPHLPPAEAWVEAVRMQYFRLADSMSALPVTPCDFPDWHVPHQHVDHEATPPLYYECPGDPIRR